MCWRSRGIDKQMTGWILSKCHTNTIRKILKRRKQRHFRIISCQQLVLPKNENLNLFKNRKFVSSNLEHKPSYLVLCSLKCRNKLTYYLSSWEVLVKLERNTSIISANKFSSNQALSAGKVYLHNRLLECCFKQITLCTTNNK